MEKQQASKADIEKVRDLFGLSHDLIAQAQFPGHVASKVQEVMQFLAYQYNDFKQRAELLAKVEVTSNVPAIPVSASQPVNAGENQPVYVAEAPKA